MGYREACARLAASEVKLWGEERTLHYAPQSAPSSLVPVAGQKGRHAAQALQSGASALSVADRTPFLLPTAALVEGGLSSEPHRGDWIVCDLGEATEEHWQIESAELSDGSWLVQAVQGHRPVPRSPRGA